MRGRIAEFEDSIQNRRELSVYLAERFAVKRAGDPMQWQKRMEHWWDLNPTAELNSFRGYVLQKDGRIGGYLGAIPVEYTVKGKSIIGISGTSWAMDADARVASMAMALRFHRLGESTLLIDSTPTPEVRSALISGGWVSVESHEKQMFPALPGARQLSGIRRYPLAVGRRFTDRISDVRQVMDHPKKEEGIVRTNDPAHLAWYLASPARNHLFGAVVDENGVASCYVVMTSGRSRCVATWEVVEVFQTDQTGRETAALLHWMLGRLPARAFLTIHCLGNATTVSCMKPVQVSLPLTTHFYRGPKEIMDVPKVWSHAEGDLGL